ncbi:RNA polymerase sigma factor [Pedosphaera parvula]|uniref:RNA polymerase, sigma-24 subunit, ECF subfamily n=1 Tax=Pedosphaera parvula (strain Ellin514) TaxID=320771 RepID=B9XLI4_PEDPL|nr:RNA polymerase sigma factor [Pedosphaera parvula]EEF59232.1 RNA polymerase, sigma-24 subunit, ECF subfamily [Pedosphaera parvula Ellin514]
MNDSALLREYLHQHSEDAFRALVQQHTNLVFGTALRRTGNATAAEEITQNVFLILARKAIWLQSHTSLAAWLHHTTLFEARQWWRGESRRQRREQTAIALETTMKTPAADSHALSDALDEALLALPERDRQALLLRFFEGRNHREVGLALGIGEDAARKRVDKALDQLSGILRKRGLVVGATAAFAASLTAASQAAPAGLSATAAQFALAKASAGTLPIITAALAKLLGMNRVHLALAGAVLLLTPLLWQGAQLFSLHQEQERMRTLLASLQSSRDLAATSESEILRQLKAASNRLARANSQPTSPSALISTNNLDPRLFSWDESADYVRVPKKSLPWLAFDGHNSSWDFGSIPGDEEKVITGYGHLSPTLLKALGLDANGQSRLQSYVQAGVQQYSLHADSLAHIQGPEALPANTPSFVKTNSDTRVWSLPTLDESADTNLKNQFVEGVVQLIGEERTEALFHQAGQDRSLFLLFQDFGKTQPMIVLTPLPAGGVSLARRFDNGEHPQWQSIDKLRISEVINSAPEGVFNPMRGFIDRPMPPQLVDYLRQWQQAHPEIPDAPTKNK